MFDLSANNAGFGKDSHIGMDHEGSRVLSNTLEEARVVQLLAST